MDLLIGAAKAATVAFGAAVAVAHRVQKTHAYFRVCAVAPAESLARELWRPQLDWSAVAAVPTHAICRCACVSDGAKAGPCLPTADASGGQQDLWKLEAIGLVGLTSTQESASASFASQPLTDTSSLDAGTAASPSLSPRSSTGTVATLHASPQARNGKISASSGCRSGSPNNSDTVSPDELMPSPLASPAPQDPSSYIACCGLEVLQFSSDVPLGRGQFGEAFSVTVPLLDGTVMPAVLKLMHEGTDPRVFEEEVAAMRDVRGVGGCVQLLASGQYKGRMAILMELCPGGTLADALTQQVKRMRGKRLTRLITPVPGLRLMATQLLRAIAGIHEAGYIHQDLKPDNVLLDAEGDLCIADFGVANARLANGTYKSRVAGTRQYMAPEVLALFRGRPTEHAISPKVDIWSAGALLADAGWLSDDPGPHWCFTRALLDYVPEHVPPDYVAFVRLLLSEDPAARPTALEALAHPWIVGSDA